jgi:actin-related protein
MPQDEPMIFNDAVALVDGEGIERDDMNLLIIDDIIPSQNDVNDVIQLPINMTDASLQLRNALHLAASGVVPCIYLEKQPAMLHTMNTFVDSIYKSNLKYCTICNENWFPGNKCDDDNISYVCCRCVKEKKISYENNNVLIVGSMSAANNMNFRLRSRMIRLRIHIILINSKKCKNLLY